MVNRHWSPLGVPAGRVSLKGRMCVVEEMGMEIFVRAFMALFFGMAGVI